MLATNDDRQNQVLILGAGSVAEPAVDYLLSHEFSVTVASQVSGEAQDLVRGKPKGHFRQLNAENMELLTKEVAEHELVISLLPPDLHLYPARACLELGVPLITTSYVSEEMAKLDLEFKEKDLLFLNEMGLDPGIDHMSAVKKINEIHKRGGGVKSFHSYCGALPAPEEALNPLGYKFSWHPKGVLQASKSSARFLEKGKERVIKNENLFENYAFKHIEGVGYFEQYPNRDSISYLETYDIPEAENIYRATLRNIGWCEPLDHLVKLGYLNDEKRVLEGETYEGLVKDLIGTSIDNVRPEVANYLEIKESSTAINTLEWLGLFDNKQIELDKGSPMEVLATAMKNKLSLREQERDMVILQHEFVADYGEAEELVTSTFVDYGDSEGYKAIARLVGLPAAIAGKLVLENQFSCSGVRIPVEPEIYKPVLAELAREGIKIEEKIQAIK